MTRNQAITNTLTSLGLGCALVLTGSTLYNAVKSNEQNKMERARIQLNRSIFENSIFESIDEDERKNMDCVLVYSETEAKSGFSLVQSKHSTFINYDMTQTTLVVSWLVDVNQDQTVDLATYNTYSLKDNLEYQKEIRDLDVEFDPVKRAKKHAQDKQEAMRLYRITAEEAENFATLLEGSSHHFFHTKEEAIYQKTKEFFIKEIKKNQSDEAVYISPQMPFDDFSRMTSRLIREVVVNNRESTITVLAEKTPEIEEIISEELRMHKRPAKLKIMYDKRPYQRIQKDYMFLVRKWNARSGCKK